MMVKTMVIMMMKTMMMMMMTNTMMMTMKMMMVNLLAPCQQLTRTLALGLLARLDRIHMPDKCNDDDVDFKFFSL